MKLAIPAIAAVAAALILTPAAAAEPCGDDCGNPYYDPNDATNAQFLATVRAAGIPGAAHGLISGARSNVCTGLDGGQTYQEIAAQLQQYSRYSPAQAHVYIAQSVASYCTNNAGKVP